jgi:hypothetical protein
MARVLPGTVPQVVAHSQPDVRPAFTWIESHADALRGQWVAVRLTDPMLVASAPTLSQLWHMVSPALLKDCVLHHIGTGEDAHQVKSVQTSDIPSEFQRAKYRVLPWRT